MSSGYIEYYDELLGVLSEFMTNRCNRYLDCGCGECELTKRIAKDLRAREVYTVDIDPTYIKLALENGFNATSCDLSAEQLPYPSNYFDIITSIEVIEHLYTPDMFFQEVYDKLKPNGLLLVSTPNLASWANRILMLFGQLPLYYDVSCRHFVRRPFQRHRSCYKHIKLYTPKVLAELGRLYGFEPLAIKGFPFPFSKKSRLLRSLDLTFAKLPSLAAGFAVVFKKPAVVASDI